MRNTRKNKKLLLTATACFMALFFCACERKTDYHALDKFSENQLPAWNRKLTQVIISDVFTPPVSSRIYAYCNIAAYEALVPSSDQYDSYAGRLNGLKPPDINRDSCYYPVSSVIAFTTVAAKLLFNGDAMKEMEQEYIAQLDELAVASDIKEKSIEFGKRVGEHIIDWASKDGYLQRNANPGFLVTRDPARWQPTPPDYMDAVEPNWGTLRPFVIDSASSCRTILPFTFDTTDFSDYYKEAKIVYEAVNNLSTKDTSIARYWDCNPNVSFTSGHVTYFQQQISPGGHWMHIAAAVAEKEKLDPLQSASVLSKVAISLADAFISCWEAKYFYNTARPETFINKYIDKDWKPFIQTPPFPEFPSGHSFISASASTMLTSLFGAQYSFIDSAEVPFGRPPQKFNSFREAAEQASVSRLYGGIHFLKTLETSEKGGREIGSIIVKKLTDKETGDSGSLILKR
jgi:hypothetical protein